LIINQTFPYFSIHPVVRKSIQRKNKIKLESLLEHFTKPTTQLRLAGNWI